MFNINKFGAHLSKLRKGKDLTQSEVADKINVIRQVVSKWERGDSFPGIDILNSLSELFEVPLDILVNAGEKMDMRVKF